MADYRCPKHDRIFESSTDHRKPGAPETDTLGAHPVNGHPDCPLCIEEAKAPKSAEQLRAEAKGRADAAQARADKAVAEAKAAQAAVDAVAAA